MSSTGIDSSAMAAAINNDPGGTYKKNRKTSTTIHMADIPKHDNNGESEAPPDFNHSVASGVTGGKEDGDSTHRQLKARHIQLIGIGGTIGTALYVQIGEGLLRGGPASLFIAFTFW